VIGLKKMLQTTKQTQKLLQQLPQGTSMFPPMGTLIPGRRALERGKHYLQTLDPAVGILPDLPEGFAVQNLGSARAWLGGKGRRGWGPQGNAHGEPSRRRTVPSVSMFAYCYLAHSILRQCK